MFGLFGKKKDENKAEDDKDKKDEGEEKDEGGDEEEEEEDDESVEDAPPEDEDNPDLFPLEAQEWARNTLGDVAFAKYYSIAKFRSESDALEMLSKRNWRVRIKNIHFTNQDKEHDIFLKFSFGTNFRVVRRYVRNKGEVTAGGPPPAKKPGPGGKPAPVPKMFKWVVSGDIGIVKLTTVKRGVPKGGVADFDDEFNFSWQGSYFDLFKKNLQVEVWDWNQTSVNEYIASFERSLRVICSDPMDQEWNIYTQVRKRGKGRCFLLSSLSNTPNKWKTSTLVRSSSPSSLRKSLTIRSS